MTTSAPPTDTNRTTFLGAAERLRAAAPWRSLAANEDLFLFDVPALGVRGAVVSVIGLRGGDAPGLLLFPSEAVFGQFYRSAQRSARGAAGNDGELLSLTFEKPSALTPSARAEAARLGWPPAAPFPLIEKRAVTGAPLAVESPDLELMTVVAATIASFTEEHREHMRDPDRIWGEELQAGGITAFVTFPVTDADLNLPLEPAPSPFRAEPKVGRNELCPCGSGKKHKRCCLDKQAPPAADPEPQDDGPDVALRLTGEIVRFGRARLGADWEAAVQAFSPEDQHADDEAELFLDWVTFEHPFPGGVLLVDAFLADRGAMLSEAERAYLQVQRQGWTSVWYVEETTPDTGSARVRDLLSTQTVVLRGDLAASLEQGQHLLARVTPLPGGEGTMAAAHTAVVSTEEGATEVRALLAQARQERSWPDPAVPLGLLRHPDTAPTLTRLWRDRFAALLELLSASDDEDQDEPTP